MYKGNDLVKLLSIQKRNNVRYNVLDSLLFSFVNSCLSYRGITCDRDRISSILETHRVTGDYTCLDEAEEFVCGCIDLYYDVLASVKNNLSHNVIKRYCMILLRENKLPDYQLFVTDTIHPMLKLLYGYNDNMNPKSEDILELYMNFVEINAFGDNTITVGQAIVLRECLVNNIPPIIFLGEDKSLHDTALLHYKATSSLETLKMVVSAQQTTLSANCAKLQYLSNLGVTDLVVIRAFCDDQISNVFDVLNILLHVCVSESFSSDELQEAYETAVNDVLGY